MKCKVLKCKNEADSDGYCIAKISSNVKKR